MVTQWTREESVMLPTQAEGVHLTGLLLFFAHADLFGHQKKRAGLPNFKLVPETRL